MTTEKKTPHHIDIHVGHRIRQQRTLRGMSQEKLGHAVGLTFQQIQKYERGDNRVGSSRLWEFSQILEVPVSFFFEGCDQQAEREKNNMGDKLMRRETLELVRAYYKIQQPERKKLSELIKAMGKAAPVFVGIDMAAAE